MKLAHLSDPHFGTLNQGADDALRNILLKIEPDLVIVSGDITQRARRREFCAARQFIKSLAPLSVTCVPGNHDIPLFNMIKRLLDPHDGFRQYIGKDLEPFVTLGMAGVLFLNSTQWWRFIDGELCDRKMRRQLQKFEERHRLRVVVFHHPLDCPGESDEENIIHRAQVIATLCAEFKVDVVLNGHIHNPLAQTSNVRYPNLARSFVISLAGTCLSTRVRPHAPNSFHFLQTCEGESDLSLTVERLDLGQDQFFIHSMSHFRRTEQGWEISSENMP